MSFRCSPERCKALCCKHDGRCLFTLELFIDEMKLFSPENTIFLLTLMNYAKTKEERAKGYANAYVSIREVFNDTRLPNAFLLFIVQSLIVGEKCPYLKDNRCSIYPRRPFICAVYPFMNSEPEVLDALQRRDLKNFQESIFGKCKECCSLNEQKFKGFNEFFREQERILKKYGRRFKDVLRRHRNFLLKLFRENRNSFTDYIRSNPPLDSWSLNFSVLLVRRIYGEEGIKAQIDAIERALNSQWANQEEKRKLKFYKEILEFSV